MAKSKKPSETQSESVAVPTPEVVTPELPKLFALALERVPGGWSTVRYTLQGDKVIERKATEPDLHAIALERIKIWTSDYFIKIA
jgi:hypothetical protein